MYVRIIPKRYERKIFPFLKTGLYSPYMSSYVLFFIKCNTYYPQECRELCTSKIFTCVYIGLCVY